MPDHFKTIRRVLVITLVLNWAVALAKIIYGFITGCASMTADGVHSLSDGSSNIVGLIAIHAAARPSDANHPYGHKKYETFGSIVIAILLGILCLDIVEHAVHRLINPSVPSVDMMSFAVMLVTMLVNIFVSRYEYSKGKQVKSDFLIADSYHTRADILVSASVIAALIGVKAGIKLIDPIVAIVIAVFIGRSIFQILMRSSGVLCDTAVVAAREIKDVVMAIKGVKGCHQVRTRGRQDDVHVDLHVTVSTKMPVVEAHAICDSVENRIKQAFPGVTDVTVHVEPATKKRKMQE